jgi:hypothetical protein
MVAIPPRSTHDSEEREAYNGDEPVVLCWTFVWADDDRWDDERRWITDGTT